MPGLTDWFSVFRCGTHRDHSGTLRTISASDIDRAIKAYVPDTAPIVAGHPALNAPAFGWVSSFRRVGDLVQARCSRVAEEFASLVERGLYKNRSLSFNGDGTFRHVGFLGAAPPAVKGLEAIQFSDKGDFVTMEMFADAAAGETAEETPEPVPAQADEQPENAAAPEVKDESAESGAAALAGEAQELKATVDSLTAKVAQLEAQIAEEKGKAQNAEFAAYADELVMSGRLKAGCRSMLMDSLQDLYGNDGGASFAAPFNDRLTRFKELLNAALPEQRVEFAECCVSGTASAQMTSDQLLAKAQELIDQETSAGRSISASAAVNRILREKGGPRE